MANNTIAILGGSFNPPHIAHFRLAHEVKEMLNVSKVIFMPCANPPHKPDANLLPFELRCEMLKLYIKEFSYFEVSKLEAELPAPSYTVETLEVLKEQSPSKKFVFVLGAEDLASFSSWMQWEKILELVDLVALPRSCDFSLERFTNLVSKLSNDFSEDNTDIPEGGLAYKLSGKKRIIFLPQPVLEISSTLIRERWNKKLSLDLFIPKKVQLLLEEKRDIANKLWSDKIN